MYNFTYENQGTNTYLVYKFTPEDAIDSMSLGMITNNHIPGLAVATFNQKDATKFINYNVSSKVSVSQFFSGAVNKKRLLGVFSGILDALFSAEEYMLDINSIILDMEYIFADVSTCDTVLICLPIERINQQSVDLGAFFKQIMFQTQFDQTENCDHVARIINYLNSAQVFSLVEFKKVIDEIKNDIPAQPVVKVSAQPQQPQVIQQPQVVQQPQVIQQPQVVQQPQIIQQSQPTVTPGAPVVINSSAVPTNKSQPVAIPSKPNQPPAAQNQAQNASNSNNNMSWFYLMQHYNKENAAVYKSQKEAKKESKKKANVKNQELSIPSKTPANTKPSVGNVGFAIPGQPTAPVSSQNTVSVSPQPVQPTQPMQQSKPINSPQPAYVPIQTPVGQAANFGETTVLGGAVAGETTVLTAMSAATQITAPHIIRTKNNEKISINKPLFRVGKERSYVDYCISDNSMISRSHANFIIRDSEYFVVDTNSTNHTYVNGNMISSNVETKINHGDAIRFANEDFEFKLY